MIRLKITDQQIEQARGRFPFGALKNSITKGKRNIYGALGEVLTIDYYKALNLKILDAPTYNYDLVIEGRTVDIKSRVLSGSPRPYFACNIPAYNTKQETEFYLFIYIKKDMSVAWLAGTIEKAKFLQLARFYKKDEPNGHGFRFPVDTFQIIARQLNKLKRRTNADKRNI
jgi:hypothetical protein